MRSLSYPNVKTLEADDFFSIYTPFLRSGGRGIVVRTHCVTRLKTQGILKLSVVVLLDEADVYLEQRSSSNLERNALVSGMTGHVMKQSCRPYCEYR